jgi:hypothetical protein
MPRRKSRIEKPREKHIDRQAQRTNKGVSVFQGGIEGQMCDGQYGAPSNTATSSVQALRGRAVRVIENRSHAAHLHHLGGSERLT